MTNKIEEKDLIEHGNIIRIQTREEVLEEVEKMIDEIDIKEFVDYGDYEEERIDKKELKLKLHELQNHSQQSKVIQVGNQKATSDLITADNRCLKTGEKSPVYSRKRKENLRKKDIDLLYNHGKSLFEGLRYFHAYDKKIKRRVPFVLFGDTLISLVTGTRIKYKEKK